MNIKRMNKALDFLSAKYGARPGAIEIKDGHCFVGATPLLPGRMERKIVELKKMTEDGTLEGVSTLRFASFAPSATRHSSLVTAEPWLRFSPRSSTLRPISVVRMWFASWRPRAALRSTSSPSSPTT